MHNSLIFSGIQATGTINIGGYLGAIKNWLNMQNEDNCMFCVMDLHAITVPQEPETLRQNVFNTIATYIACGIKPEKSPMYAQSQVKEHTELSWILGCLTPMGWLNRMTQFKSKAGKDKEKAGLGLYAYPVLMAADILIYKASLIPVGEDQTQHVELARDIAGAFNRFYNVELFPLPKAIINKQSMRIMSLRDASQKMSKSDPSDFSRINLTDSNDAISNKIKKAVTDSIPEIYYDSEKRPAVSNLLNVYSAIQDLSIEEAEKHMQGLGSAKFKELLAEAIIQHLSPIREEINRLINHEKPELEKIMNSGAQKGREIAQNTMKEVRKLVGLTTI